MFPAKTWSEIGGWLSDYDDFSNFAVALGVKWNPGTQAQRLIRKYGGDFLVHSNWDDSGPTRTKRHFIQFSAQQLEFYRFVIRRMPEVVKDCLKETARDPDVVEEWWHIEAFLQLGVYIPHVSPQWIEHIMNYEPAVVELLLHNGILRDHNMTLDTYFQWCFHAPDHCSWVARLIRWGIPMDLDALLDLAVRYTTNEYEPLEEDRIIRKFDPRAQSRTQAFIQQLLNFGADPNTLTDTPTDPGVMEVLLQYGAEPELLGWTRSTRWRMGRNDEGKIALWVKYGWGPLDLEDIDWYFYCLLSSGWWDAADTFLTRFGRTLAGVVGRQGLRIAVEGRQLDLVRRMVKMFPEVLREDNLIFRGIVKWYADVDWKMDLGLIETVLSTGCSVDTDSLLMCIKGDQRDIARKAIFQPERYIGWLGSEVKDGPAWVPKLDETLRYLRQSENKWFE
ncbi:hypothetical protein HK102_006333 [Quaeritorhiza haematococci]|nr:hypothetical protein HK102_006333 [Quaeritorhiza haematococci]